MDKVKEAITFHVVGAWSQLVSLWRMFAHSWAKRSTVQYPEEKPYLPPRYRGRIVLTRDPDGEERCVACNLCAVACPVACISLQKAEKPDGRWYPEWFRTAYLAFYLLLLACAVLGAYRLAQSGQWAAVVLCVCFVLSVGVVQSIFFVEGRHRWEVESGLVILAACGVGWRPSR